MAAPGPIPFELQQALEKAQSEITRLRKVIQLKDEQIRLLNFRFFGPKSEKLSSTQIPLLLEELRVSAGEVEQEAERPQSQKQLPLPETRPPRASHPGREPLPQHLERREEIIPCCPEDCHCAKCGAERPVIGYETREELACAPAQFWIRVIKREKRGSQRFRSPTKTLDFRLYLKRAHSTRSERDKSSRTSRRILRPKLARRRRSWSYELD